MKVLLNVSLDHEKDQDIIDVLGDQPHGTRSKFVRNALRFYINQELDNEQTTMAMMEELLKEMKTITDNQQIVYVQSQSETSEQNASIITGPQDRGINRLQNNVQQQELVIEQKSVEDDPKLQSIGDAIDNIGQM